MTWPRGYTNYDAFTIDSIIYVTEEVIRSVQALSNYFRGHYPAPTGYVSIGFGNSRSARAYNPRYNECWNECLIHAWIRKHDYTP